jgi:glutamate 5-kinase
VNAVAATVGGARRLVVKVGSSLVTDEGRGIDPVRVADWCRQLAVLLGQDREVVMVSSGAIAEGMQRLGWSLRPRAIHELQAAAAVGQMGLAQAWETGLRAQGIRSAQVLLTHADLADRERYLNARSTLRALLALDVVPVVNENDTVVNDEIKFGDNDTLAALVANLLEADLLLILTDQSGLYSADPRKDPTATLLSEVRAGDPALERIAGGAGTLFGSGGMLTKVTAAKRAARSGADTIVASGREPDVLVRLAAGERLGTTFVADTAKVAARKQWLIDQLKVRGTVTVDAGAAARVTAGGASLLPIGVTAVEGLFHRGEVIAVRGPDGAEIGRGLANYGSDEARRIARKPSSAFEALLGYQGEPELVHRDNFVRT